MIEEKLPQDVILPDYNESILNLSCSIQQHFGITPKHPTLHAADGVLANNFPHVVVILLDGLGMNILEKHLHPKDFLRRNLLTDYSSVFPPTTTASTTSFLSGLSPLEHGWLGWDVYFEQEDKTVTCFKNTIQGTDEKAADYDVARKYLPFENIIDQINKAGTAKAYGVFPFGPDAHTDIDDWCYTIERSCYHEGKTFTYAYWEQPDALLHKEGTNSNDVAKLVQDLNAKMANLCARCKDTIFFITADHGHIDIRNEYLEEDYSDIAKMLVRKPSIEPRAISFYVKPEYLEEFPREFYDKFGKEYIILSKQEVLDQQLFGPGFANENLTGIGDYMAIAYKYKTVFWNKNEKKFKSHHAGLSKEEMSIPLIRYVNKNRHTGLIIWYSLAAVAAILLLLAVI